MIAWSRILLLEGCLVLFIYDDKSQPLERQEDGTSRSQYHVIRLVRQLLLPDFHTFSITVFRVIDTQTVTEDLVQSLHNLYGQGDFRQQIEHLLVLFDGFSDEMDVDFRLSTGSNSMQKYHVFLHHLHQYLIIGILLCHGQGFDQIQMRLTRSIQSAHFQLVSKENATVDKRLHDSRRTVGFVHQLFLRYLPDTFPWSISLQTIPMRKGEEGGKSLRLLQRTLHHTESHMQRLLIPESTCQLHIEFHLGLEFLSRFHSRRHGSIIYISQ